MSSEKLHNDHMNQLLSKLTAGTLTEAERWSLERASLDDPFLADALEGYYTEGEQQGPALYMLREKLRPAKSGRKRKLVPWRIMSAAACLVMLTSVALWIFSPKMNVMNAPTAAAHKNASGGSAKNSVTSAAQSKDRTSAHDTQQSNKEIEEMQVETMTNKALKQPKPPMIPSPTTQENETPIKSKASRVIQEIEEELELEPLARVTEKVKVEKAEAEIISETLPMTDKVGGLSQEVNQDRADDIAVFEEEAQMPQSTTTAKKVAKHRAERSTTEDDLLTEPARHNFLPHNERENNQASDYSIENNLQLKNDSGQVLPGVEILDLDNNFLGSSDVNGNFLVSQEQPYVIAAYAGYDSLTIATAPNLSVAMKSSSELLSQPHMRLVDQMDDAEVIHFYTSKLNTLFSRYWPLCTNPQVSNNFFTGVSIYLTIEPSGNLSEPEYFRDLDASCQEKIKQVLRIAEEQQLFYSSRPIRFTYRVNI